MAASETTNLNCLTRSAPKPRVQYRRYRSSYALLTLAALAFSAWLVWLFYDRTRGTAIPAATEIGRWYGLVGVALFVFLALYGLRRIGYRQRAGSLEFWYRTHLVLGLVALALVGAHSASAFLGAQAAGYGPGPIAALRYAFRSPFLGVLQIGVWGVMATGILQWVLQSTLKQWMIRNESRPTILMELNESRARLLAELQLLTGEDDTKSALASQFKQDALARATQQMALGRMAGVWLFRDVAYWEKQLERTEEVSGLNPEARHLLRELNRVEVLRFYHKLIRFWTTVHLLFTGLVVQMMAWHVYLVSFRPR